MFVEVYTRHAVDCRQKSNRSAKNCRCPKWLYWHYKGKPHRKSAGTRSWEKAQQKARAIELRHEHTELGKKPTKDEPLSLEKAVEFYLADK
jgi:hypothetical protein